MRDKHFLNIFFDPKSVALVGLSRKVGRGTFNILENLTKLEYAKGGKTELRLQKAFKRQGQPGGR
jgi:hypothetical protein